MKAIVLHEPGSVDQLVYTDLPKPLIQSDEVLIQVKAISINPVDVKTRAGKGIFGRLRTEAPLILGWDIAGTVVEIGSDVTDFAVGDDVFGMVNFPGRGKAYAEYVAAPASQLAHKPENCSFEEAAASTLAALTAYQAFTHKAPLQAGQKVLIHAAAGGVGHFAVQIAKHLGAYVLGTSSAPNKEFVLALGADEHIDYSTQKLEDVVSEVDIVLDLVGGENIARSLHVVKPGGTVISIPTGISEELMAQAQEKGVNAFFFLVQSNGDDMKQIATLLGDGTVKAHVSTIYDFSDMPAAHSQQETGKTRGKLVVKLNA